MGIEHLDVGIEGGVERDASPLTETPANPHNAYCFNNGCQAILHRLYSRDFIHSVIIPSRCGWEAITTSVESTLARLSSSWIPVVVSATPPLLAGSLVDVAKCSFELRVMASAYLHGAFVRRIDVVTIDPSMAGSDTPPEEERDNAELTQEFSELLAVVDSTIHGSSREKCYLRR